MSAHLVHLDGQPPLLLPCDLHDWVPAVIPYGSFV
jgi:hypothetical protein